MATPRISLFHLERATMLDHRCGNGPLTTAETLAVKQSRLLLPR